MEDKVEKGRKSHRKKKKKRKKKVIDLMGEW